MTNIQKFPNHVLVSALACTILDSRGVVVPPPALRVEDHEMEPAVAGARFLVRNEACEVCIGWLRAAEKNKRVPTVWLAPETSPLVAGLPRTACEACIGEIRGILDAAAEIGIAAEDAHVLMNPELTVPLADGIDEDLQKRAAEMSRGDGREQKYSPQYSELDLGSGPDAQMNVPAFLLLLATMEEAEIADMLPEARPLVRRLKARADRAIAQAEAAALVQAVPIVRARDEIILDALNVRKVVAYVETLPITEDDAKRPGVVGKAHIDVHHVFRLALGEDVTS